MANRKHRQHDRKTARLSFESLEPRCLLSADSTVVFNEIMYHPADNEPGMEWIELHNQMAVDMDLSGWSLDGGVQFPFVEGTVIPGGGYLVIAESPAVLQANTGFQDALGPYTGKLSNGGERLVLSNNNDRLMDEVTYGDENPWPVAADGSGASLAKIAPRSPSEPVENWTQGGQAGGTPGAANFPEEFTPIETSIAVPLNASWKYEATGSDLGADWRDPDFDDDGWTASPMLILPVLITEAGTGSPDYFEIQNLSDSTLDTTGWVVAANNAYNYDINDVHDPLWAFPDSLAPGELIHRPDTQTDNIFWRTKGSGWVMILDGGGSVIDFVVWGYTAGELDAMEIDVGTFQDIRPASAWSGSPVDSSTATFSALQRIGNLDHDNAADWTFDEDPSPDVQNAGLVLPFVGHGMALPPAHTTYYFRNEFDFSGPAEQAELALRLLVDDGAVLYLNGEEVYRHNMPAGEVTYETLALTEVGDATFAEGIKLPTGALRQGTNHLAVELHQSAPDDADALFGLELIATLWPAQWYATNLAVAFNEVGIDGTSQFFLELANDGGLPIELGGYVIAASGGQEYVLPEQALGAGDLLSLDETQLGFRVASGEKVFLYSPGRDAVFDALEVDNVLRGRSADGRWLYPSLPTPGGPNQFVFHDEIVINEIMYHHRPELGEIYAENDEEWIELFNRSTSAVDLSGWKLDEAVRYEFQPGTIIEPGEYLVVANNVTALAGKYPSIDIVGSFAARLSNFGERIVLLDPRGNPADEVHYFDGGRWPSYADGDGSSLELKDPRADNSNGEAWAASDEAAKTSWQEYTYRGVAQLTTPGEPMNWYELDLGMLDGAGEILLDDISLIEQPDGAALEFIQNGSFDGGTAAYWRLRGNHQRSEVIVDPDDPGNYVLHLISSGATEYQGNQLETTFVGGQAVNNGVEYEISFRAKWLAGSRQLNSRVYFNRLPKVTVLDVPELNGTPGQQNSRYVANAGPTYDELRHSPATPQPGEDVTVSVRAADPDGVGPMTLRYSIAEGAWASTLMTQTLGGVYSAVIPGQTSGTVVQFYVDGQDSLGATSMMPQAGLDSRALLKVEDGQSKDGPLHNFLVIMLPSEANYLHTSSNVWSNERLGATVVYDRQDVFYNAGVRLKGSYVGRDVARVGFNIALNPDDLFRGVHEKVSIDRSAHALIGQDEILLKHIANHAGDIPGMYDDLVHFISPKSGYTSTAQLRLAGFDDIYLDSQFENGSDGTEFEYEGFRVRGGGYVDLDIQDFGDDKEAYRWLFLINNNRKQDDYSQVIEFAKTFSLFGSALDAATRQVMDVDQWMRAFALQSLGGVADVYGRAFNSHNLRLYVRPSDGKVLAMPWDWDSAFLYATNNSIFPGSNIGKIVALPANRRLFYGHLLDMINTTFNTSYMSTWTEHYGELAGQNFSARLSYIGGRANYVLGQLPAQIPFIISTNNGNDFSVDDSVVTLAGSGWIDVRDVYLNGQLDPLDVIWLDDQRWQLTIPIGYGDNLLNFEARNHQGAVVGSDSITVGSTISQRPLQDFLRITEMNYNPHDPTPNESLAGFTNNDDFEFIELTNTGPVYLDLTGARFTDGIDFDFTAAGITSMAPGEYVVLARNLTAFAERYGSVPNLIGPYTGGLSNGGEHLLLLDPQSAVIHDFTFGDSGTAGWPDRADGNGASLQIIFTYEDYNDPANWRSSSEYLGSPGSEGSGPYQGVVVNEVLTHTPDSPLAAGEGQGEGLLVDAIELYNPTGTEVVLDGWWLSDSAGDFFKFQIPAGTTIPAYGYVTFYEGHYEGLSFVVDQATEFGGTGAKDFALSGSRGDDVWLLADFGGGSSLQFADHVEFGGALAGEPFGRWPNGTGELYPMTSRTLDEENSGPRPPQQVVISEVMYNPPGNDVPDELEYLELYNFTSQAVNLTGWRLRKGFDYDFAPGTMLDAEEALVIVSFDPSDVIKLADFRAAYGIGPEVTILGNPADTLSDTGEQIQLQRPDTPPPNDPLYVPHVIEDEVDYLSTWHVTTDGDGDSLNRTARTDWGGDASSWTAEPPTPGTAQLQEVAQVEGRYLFYNNSAYDKTSDTDAIATDKAALLPGEQATFANYTSYVHGINGIMIDITGLTNPDAIDENDFIFKIGNDDTPANWPDAPAPVSIDATDSRITLTWPDGAIRNTWLEVTVLATENTGLDTADVFYFGNAVGETGDCSANAKVDMIDVLMARQYPQPFFDPAMIDNLYDFNRDRRVNAIDALIARNNQTWSGTELELIDLAAQAAAVESASKNAGQARPLNGELEKVH